MDLNKINISIFLFLTICICACSSTTLVTTDAGSIIDNESKESFKKYIGKRITVIGTCVDMNLGAALILGNGQRVWIEKMERWPAGYYTGDAKSKTVKVVGTLIEKNDLPVFIQKENDKVIQGGMPVPEGTDLKEASHRYLLKDYVWNEIK
jgi:hypothetical protein